MSAHAQHLMLTIREQTLDDPVSGFVFKFVFVSNSENPSRILFKNTSDTTWREYIFDVNGDFGGATTRPADTHQQPALRLVK
jgi:hypothetical protein